MTLNPASPLARLLAAPMRPGVVTWLGIRPRRLAPVVAVGHLDLEPGQGVAGDHYSSVTAGARQVTIMAGEHLQAIASFLGLAQVPPEVLRRNVLVRGTNLLALKGRTMRLGMAVLEHSGECHPCSKMEAALGPGGYNAVRGHGGITARVLEAGMVRLGDTLEALP